MAQDELEHIEQFGIDSAIVANPTTHSLMDRLAILLLGRLQFDGKFSFPVSLHDLLPYRHVREVTEVQYPTVQSGSLLPVTGGFHMFVRQGDPHTRQRWTIAHEMGHSFFFDISRETPKPTIHDTSSDLVEQLCDEFSAALLMPRTSMIQREHRTCRHLNHEAIESDSRFYGVSIPSFLIRLRELNVLSKPEGFVLVFENLPNRKSGLLRKPRVTIFLASRDAGLYVPTNIGADKLGLNGPLALLGPTSSPSSRKDEEILAWKRGLSGKFSREPIRCMTTYKTYRSSTYSNVIGIFEPV